MIESDSDKPTVEVKMRRYTRYWCSDYNKVKFYTVRRNRTTSTAQWVFNKYEFRWRFSEVCKHKCISQNVSLRMTYKNKRINSRWNLLGEVTYLYKNCDKLYWTNWIETTNCSLSRHRDNVRYCEDCDGDEVDEKHCSGISTVQEDCLPIWSEWIEEGPCVVTGCNPTTGERGKRRQCLYGDGSATMNHELCSNDLTMVKEQCTNNILPMECSTNTTSLYIGIGVGIDCHFFLFCLLLCYIIAEIVEQIRHRIKTRIRMNYR